jgi:hypothetical protein
MIDRADHDDNGIVDQELSHHLMTVSARSSGRRHPLLMS